MAILRGAWCTKRPRRRAEDEVEVVRDGLKIEQYLKLDEIKRTNIQDEERNNEENEEDNNNNDEEEYEEYDNNDNNEEHKGLERSQSPPGEIKRENHQESGSTGYASRSHPVPGERMN
ncbi:hypothetical protein K1719_012228 [Acacia pycnantha]|nr:hypothetical protein K1719_012228 [Acacia pycnantha]